MVRWFGRFGDDHDEPGPVGLEKEAIVHDGVWNVPAAPKTPVLRASNNEDELREGVLTAQSAALFRSTTRS